MTNDSHQQNLRVVNAANVPCNGRWPCSPEGKWKGRLARATVEAPGGSVLSKARVSCIARPCPFTSIRSDRFSGGGRRFSTGPIPLPSCSEQNCPVRCSATACKSRTPSPSIKRYISPCPPMPKECASRSTSPRSHCLSARPGTSLVMYCSREPRPHKVLQVRAESATVSNEPFERLRPERKAPASFRGAALTQWWLKSTDMAELVRSGSAPEDSNQSG